MRRSPQTLKCIEPGKSDPILDCAVAGDAITFDVGDWDYIGFQLDLVAGAAFPAAVITYECSYDGTSFGAIPAGAVTYNSVGVKARVDIASMLRVRLRVTTATGSAGAVTVRVTARGSNAA